MDSDTRAAGIAVLLLIVASVGWYFWWVQPREDYLLAVAECTADGSRAEWDRCTAIVASAQPAP